MLYSDVSTARRLGYSESASVARGARALRPSTACASGARRPLARPPPAPPARRAAAPPAPPRRPRRAPVARNDSLRRKARARKTPFAARYLVRHRETCSGRRRLRRATRARSFGRTARRSARLLDATSAPLHLSRDELVPRSKPEPLPAPKLIGRSSPPTGLCGSPRSLRRGPRSRTRGLRQEFARLAWPLARPTERIPRSPSRRRHDAARQTGSGAGACIWPVGPIVYTLPYRTIYIYTATT